MLKVGSSISMRGKATGFSGSAMVSPISTDPSPTMATMSPASAVSTSVRPSLSKTITLSIDPATILSAAFISTAFCPRFTRPETIRPTAIRPTYSEKSSVVQSMRNGPSGSTTGPGTWLDDHLEERLDVAGSRVGVVRREAGFSGGVDIGKIELIFAGPLLDERVEDLVQDFGGPGIGAIDLVDHDDGPDMACKGFAEHELGLRHRPFERVDQDQGAVGHLERALDLAAEIGVAGRIDQVDLGVAVLDGDVLGQDGDAPFPLEVVGVENPLSLEL